jgi:hypothetical protein
VAFDFDFRKMLSGDPPPANSTSENPSGSAINVNTTQSAQIVQERISRRGRPPGSGTKKDATGERGLSPEEAKALDAVFAPDAWRGLVRLPSDAATMLTGSKVWELSKPEVDTLATGAATCARYFVKTDPKWIALMLFSSALITVYGSRVVAYRNEQATKLRGPQPNAGAQTDGSSNT